MNISEQKVCENLMQDLAMTSLSLPLLSDDGLVEIRRQMEAMTAHVDLILYQRKKYPAGSRA